MKVKSLRTTRGRTVLTLVPGREKRPPTPPIVYRMRQRERLYAAGLCVDGCGRKRKTYKYRCDVCQAVERDRWNRTYAPRFYTIRAKV